MAKNTNKRSFFERAMNLADRFFDGVNKLQKAGVEARIQNVELLDQMNPSFKESYEKSMQKVAEVGSKLEGKTEKILFGRDLYLGAGGETRREEDKRRSLDDQIKSASSRAGKFDHSDKGPKKIHESER